MVIEYKLHKVIVRACSTILLIVLGACSNDATSEVIGEDSKPEIATVRLSVTEGQSVGSAIHSVVLCGSPFAGDVTNPGHVTNSRGSYPIPHYEATRSFFFVTNLTDADKAIVQSTQPSAFKNLLLNTSDYIPTPTTAVPVPMLAMLINKNWAELLPTSTPSWNLTRLFAVVDYTITFPSGAYQLVNVAVKNIPAKFAVASPIDDYDLTANGYLNYNLSTQMTGKFFLPENKVSDPVFFDADDNGMTYMEVQYKDPATADEVHTAKFRIAEYTGNASYAAYGNVNRNNIYTFTISITSRTKNNVTQFLN